MILFRVEEWSSRKARTKALESGKSSSPISCAAPMARIPRNGRPGLNIKKLYVTRRRKNSRIFAVELAWIDLYCLQPREKMLKTYSSRSRPAKRFFSNAPIYYCINKMGVRFPLIIKKSPIITKIRLRQTLTVSSSVSQPKEPEEK